MRKLATIAAASGCLLSSAMAQDVYWTIDEGCARVDRASLDTFASSAILPSASHIPASVAIDTAGDMLYFTLRGDCGGIARVPIAGGPQEHLISGLEAPRNMAIDSATGDFYWVDTALDAIFRSNAAGGNVEQIVSHESISSVAADFVSGKLYWITQQADGILRANLDGTQTEVIVPGVWGEDIAVDGPTQKIYWILDSGDSIQRANTDGSGVETVISGLVRSYYIAVDSSLDLLVISDLFETDSIRTCRLDGSGLTTIWTATEDESPSGLAVHPGTGLLYSVVRRFSNAGAILQSTATGTDLTEVLSLDRLSHATALAVAYYTDRVFFTLPGSSRGIGSVALDGTNLNEIIDSERIVDSISFDGVNDRLYWLDRSNTLYRSAFDGTQIESTTTGNDVRDIFFDMVTNRLYWVGLDHFSNGTVGWTDFETGTSQLVVSGLGQYPDEIVVDGAASAMYVLLNTPAFGSVARPFTDILLLRMDLDGTNQTLLRTVEASHASGLTLDAVNEKLYWLWETRGGDGAFATMQRCSLDGSDLEDLPIDLMNPGGDVSTGTRDIVVVRPNLIVETGGARYLNVSPPSAGALFALRVTSADHPCLEAYVSPDGLLGDQAAYLSDAHWRKVFVRGGQILPSTNYTVSIETPDGTIHDSASATTGVWGDTSGDFIDGAWEPGDGEVNISDAVAVLDGFQNLVFAPPIERIDLYPEQTDGQIDIADVVMVVHAFQGQPYPFSIPCP